MAFIIRYIEQSKIDMIEKLTERKLDAETIERMKFQTISETEVGAQRLVEHFRSTGCIAAYYHETELQ